MEGFGAPRFVALTTPGSHKLLSLSPHTLLRLICGASVHLALRYSFYMGGLICPRRRRLMLKPRSP